METVTRVLATTSEISLKGGNRKWFERTLTDNVRNALADLPVAAVTRPAWRVLISFSKPCPSPRWRAGCNGLRSRRDHGGGARRHTIDDLQTHLEPRLEEMDPRPLRSAACAPTSPSP